jgi:2-polyprenyl-3-methyl-5-hydroxy-6-metoxy-1,4-benzoquinol methylase
MGCKVIPLAEARRRAPARANLDWSKATEDYLAFRPGYTDDYFRLLQYLGVGLRGQHILDLGTGTGVLALPFARQGARVTALDRSPEQIASAQNRAASEGLDIRFLTALAEDVELDASEFDVATASMCWSDFDRDLVAARLRRALRPGGLLLISAIAWLSDSDEIVRASENLIASYSEGFSSPVLSLDPDPSPSWAKASFTLKTYHRDVVSLPFTQESWRGRLRASRWIGAALPEKQVKSFDRDLCRLLKNIAPQSFRIEHGIRVQIFQAL